jgi:predicted PurR-regulated permease PerM
MAKGLGTPIWIILLGVFGGTIVHGMIGLFIGPVVLSIVTYVQDWYLTVPTRPRRSNLTFLSEIV